MEGRLDARQNGFLLEIAGNVVLPLLRASDVSTVQSIHLLF